MKKSKNVSFPFLKYRVIVHILKNYSFNFVDHVVSDK